MNASPDRTLARLHFQPGTFTIRDGTPGFARGASFTPWRPSANWADCGPLLERYEVTLEPLTLPHPEGTRGWHPHPMPITPLPTRHARPL